MKTILKFIIGLLMTVFIGSVVSNTTGLPLNTTIVVLLAVGTALSFAPRETAILRLDVLTELWTGELLQKFRHFGEWLSVIPSHNEYVNNNVIHLADVGADPDVLINNTIYPITVSDRTDTDIPVALKKFDTTNTSIPRDQLYALPYDKVGSVLNQHRTVLEERTMMYGLYSLAPAANTADTPIVKTTGGATAAGNRKKFTVADVATLTKKMDDLRIPLIGRVLILCNDHLNDLLTGTDATFRDRFYNTQTGQPLDFYGFRIFRCTYNPVYNAGFTKVAFNAVSAGTDHNASVAFYAPRAFQAMGSVEMFYRDAKLDPETRKTVLGFQMYHIVLPKKTLGFCAIVSDDFV